MQRYKEDETKIIQELTSEMRKIYNESRTRSGHDFTHIERGLKRIVVLCEDTNVSSFIAQVTVIFHDMHRIFNFNDETIQSYVSQKLAQYPLSTEEISSIIEAILEHHKLNDPNDSELTILLKDTDRLDCLSAIGITRICQHNHLKLPYRETDPFVYVPGKLSDLESLIDVFHFVLEWEEMLRLPKAKEMAKGGIAFLKDFIEIIRKELDDANDQN